MRRPCALIPLATLPFLAASIIVDCEHLLKDGVAWDISPLSGVHTVHHIDHVDNWRYNTTFTLNVCENMKTSDDFCDNGTRVCAQRWSTNEEEGDKDSDKVPHVWSVAGDFTTKKGARYGLEPKIARLKDSGSNEDKDKEGFLLFLHGGEHKINQVRARAIIEFKCNRDKTGLEGEGKESRGALRSVRGADYTYGDEPGYNKPGYNKPNPDEGKSLRFHEYRIETPGGKDSDAVETLRLIWETKYACEDQKDKEDPDSPKKPGWGFFTWFIIM